MVLCKRVFAVAGCVLALLGMQARADGLVQVATRGDQSISYWWMPAEGATATVLLLSGGSGGIGIRQGQPQSNNFLIRSRDLFRAEGFNVALLGNPTDQKAMDDAWRTSEMHRTDVAAVMADIRAKGATQAIWLVGTSRGTISAAALAIGLSDQVAGVVLTSSVASFSTPTAVHRLAIDQLQMPVLVYHHREDACRITLARDAEWIFKGLKNARVKKFWVVEGGENPSGNACEALHWHGFVGMEGRAVKDVSVWIRQPSP